MVIYLVFIEINSFITVMLSCKSGGNVLTLRVLEYTQQSIVYELPPGKPDPHFPCMEGVDNRPRVRQSVQKGDSCAYYTINRIRQRIGASPTTEALKKARQLEQICSLWRKKITRLYLEFPYSDEYLFSARAETELATNHAKIFYHLISGGADRDAQSVPESKGRTMKALLQAFLQQDQYKLFYQFLREEYASQSMAINRWFLSQLSPPSLQFIENRCKEGNVSTQTQIIALLNVAMACMVKSYGLAHSNWKPEAGIKDLVYQLQAQGPIAVFGHLGAAQYIDPPQRLSIQFADRAVFGWKKDSKKQNHLSGHAVVIVGAKYEGSIEQIYYIDCHDPSDPANPALQRIYAISYRTLVAGLYNVYGLPELDHQTGFAYAWGQA